MVALLDVDRAARAALTYLLPVDVAAAAAAADPVDALACLVERGDRLRDQVRSVSAGVDLGRELLRHAAGKDIGFLVPADEGWPLLAPIAVAPAGLWVRGVARWPSLAADTVTILGTHRLTAYGEHVAAATATAVAQHGHTVATVAGSSLSAAVLGSASAENAPVVALLACGLDVLPAHAWAGHAARVGVLASVAPPGTAATMRQVRYAERILVAASPILVVVEAEDGSRLIPVAADAFHAGLRVLAVPGPITSAVSHGCHELLAAGHARPLRSPSDALPLRSPSDALPVRGAR